MKQRKAVEALAENGGVVSKAMLSAGYSPMTAQDPKKLTESDGWHELMDKHLDDKKLAAKHEALLNDDKHEIQIKALDLAYKVKAKIGDDNRPPPATTININFFANPKIIDATKAYDEQLKQAIINDEIQEPDKTL